MQLNFEIKTENIIVAREASGLEVGVWPVGTSRQRIARELRSISGLTGRVSIRVEEHDFDSKNGACLTIDSSKVVGTVAK